MFVFTGSSSRAPRQTTSQAEFVRLAIDQRPARRLDKKAPRATASPDRAGQAIAAQACHHKRPNSRINGYNPSKLRPISSSTALISKAMSIKPNV